MTLIQFLTVSGVLAWALMAWRMFQFMHGLPSWLVWALWRHKRNRVLRRYG